VPLRNCHLAAQYPSVGRWVHRGCQLFLQVCRAAFTLTLAPLRIDHPAIST